MWFSLTVILILGFIKDGVELCRGSRSDMAEHLGTLRHHQMIRRRSP